MGDSLDLPDELRAKLLDGDSDVELTEADWRKVARSLLVELREARAELERLARDFEDVLAASEKRGTAAEEQLAVYRDLEPPSYYVALERRWNEAVAEVASLRALRERAEQVRATARKQDPDELTNWYQGRIDACDFILGDAALVPSPEPLYTQVGWLGGGALYVGSKPVNPEDKPVFVLAPSPEPDATRPPPEGDGRSRQPAGNTDSTAPSVEESETPPGPAPEWFKESMREVTAVVGASRVPAEQETP